VLCDARHVHDALLVAQLHPGRDDVSELMSASLDIELTRRCNLTCGYCFVGWSRDWTSQMPVDVAHQIVAEGSGMFPTLHFTGGEPFAYRAPFELLDARRTSTTTRSSSTPTAP
jgi:MoaA/NifB/PqqE/SkfB family radical SAM enzyme